MTTTDTDIVDLVKNLREELVCRAGIGIHESYAEDEGGCPGGCVVDAYGLVDQLIREAEERGKRSRDEEVAGLEFRLARLLRFNETKDKAIRDANITLLKSHGEEDLDFNGEPRKYSWDQEYKEPTAALDAAADQESNRDHH